MARYRMGDGTITDTARARQTWEEARYWDGSNNISRATGSQWEHQQLYRSAKGRYYLECWSEWQGTRPYAEWMSPAEAARWLVQMGHRLPADLVGYADCIE